MRIGIFTDTYPPYINGVSTSIVMLQHALEKKGHQVFIVAPNAENLSYKYENDEKIIRIPGIPIGIYDYRLTGIYPFRAIEKIRSWNLDVIHSNTEFGVGTFARIIAKQFDIPIVHTYHTMYEDYVHYITKGYFTNSSKKVVEYLTKFYCDKTATELIVPTKKAYSLFKEKYKVDRNVYIVPTGIEVERFYKEKFSKREIDGLRQQVGLSKEDFVILFVGRMGKEKSVDFLIENHAALVKKNPRAKLLLIGDGPDIEELKELAKKQKIKDSILFLGKIPWEEIPKYYQLASVFTTASVTETQGLTVIEAMAAGIPAVTINDESFRETVIHGMNGYLFKNRRQYKKLMCDLMEDPKLLSQLGKHARVTSEKHSASYFADQVLDIYNIALGDRKLKKEKKSFFQKLKRRIKKVFHGKK